MENESEKGFLLYLCALNCVTQGVFAERLSKLLTPLKICDRKPCVSIDAFQGQWFRYVPYVHEAVRTGFITVSDETATNFYNMQVVVDQISESLVAENRNIVSALTRADVVPIFFKGRELSKICHGVPRISGDTDYLVPREMLDAAEKTFATLGYQKGLTNSTNIRNIFDPDANGFLKLSPIPDRNVKQVLEYHHQVHPLYKIIRSENLSWLENIDILPAILHIFRANKKTYLLCIVDLHFNLAFGLDENDFNYHYRTLKIYGDGDQFVAPEILVPFFCGRAYYEPLIFNEHTYRDLIDLVAILTRFEDSIDWDWVLSFGSKYQIEAGLYYCLKHVRRMFPELVPNDVFPFLEKRLSARPEFDLGDFVPKCFNVVKYSEDYHRFLEAIM